MDKGGHAQAIMYARFVDGQSGCIDTKFSGLLGVLMLQIYMNMLKHKVFQKINSFIYY